jgi:hypothetical protein
MNVISEHPPRNMYASGLEIECQCARCGGSTVWHDCWNCDDGYIELYDEDPLWYDPDDIEACDVCRGRGGWNCCGNEAEWCQAHPLPGREDVKRGMIEWFTIEPKLNGIEPITGS